MTDLQTLTRELRERIRRHRRTTLLLAAPELAGALTLVDLLLGELATLGDRVALLERDYHGLLQLMRSADVLAHAHDLDRDGFHPGTLTREVT